MGYLSNTMKSEAPFILNTIKKLLETLHIGKKQVLSGIGVQSTSSWDVPSILQRPKQSFISFLSSRSQLF